MTSERTKAACRKSVAQDGFSDGIDAAVTDHHIARDKAGRFGIRCEARLPAMDGEQSRAAAEFNSAQYWRGFITREVRDATADEIERAAHSYFVRGVVAHAKNRRSKAAILRREIIKRDGDKCWLCGGNLPAHDRTLEHLVAQSNGGTDELHNLAVTHEACNKLLGNLPLSAKLALRDRFRSEAA